jgi:hypothetical protein
LGPPTPAEAASEAKEGDEAEEVLDDSRRKTTSRRELARNPRFEQVSPEVGELDEAAWRKVSGTLPTR